MPFRRLSLSLVVAADSRLGIGKDGGIPWKLKGDMKWFREITTCPDPDAVLARYRLDTGHRDKRRFPHDQLLVTLGTAAKLPPATAEARNAVLMGRRTWDSLPAAFRPLPGRLNGILSRGAEPGDHGTHRVWPDWDAALTDLAADPTVRNVYVVGGGDIYAQALRRPECDRILLTSLEGTWPCDTFFPDPGAAFAERASSPVAEEGGMAYRYRLLERVAGVA